MADSFSGGGPSGNGVAAPWFQAQGRFGGVGEESVRGETAHDGGVVEARFNCGYRFIIACGFGACLEASCRSRNLGMRLVDVLER